MEILTEQQQVEKQAKEVFTSYQIMDNDLSKMKNKLSNYRGRIFKNEGNERVMMYNIGVLEKVVMQLYSYQSLVNKELEKLKNNEKK